MRERLRDGRDPGDEYPLHELEEAFAWVADPHDAMRPVDTLLPAGENWTTYDLIRAAVLYFTGCEPTFERIEGGVRVRAPRGLVPADQRAPVPEPDDDLPRRT